MNEVIIVGSGPSGYTAATYLARARMEPLLFSGTEIGGQLMYTTEVENYSGFPEGVNGPDLMFAMRRQAERFGTKIIDSLITKIEKTDGGFTVWQGETQHQARAVILSTGARSRTLSLPREKELTGRGVSTCAVCDAAFFRDRETYVVGGGDSAMEDALALTKHAKKVHMVHRRGEFRASKIMQERVLSHPKIEVHWNTEVIALQDDGQRLTGLTLRDNQSKTERQVPTDGLFFAIGHVPSTAFVKDTVELTGEGYIATRLSFDKTCLNLAQQNLDEQGKVLFPTMTSVEGIFAAGDCVDFRYRQAITAAGYGAMAALDAERWLESHKN